MQTWRFGLPLVSLIRAGRFSSINASPCEAGLMKQAASRGSAGRKVPSSLRLTSPQNG